MLRLLESAAVVICALLLSPLVLALVQRIRIRKNFDYAMQVLAQEAVKRANQEHQAILDFTPASAQRLEEDILAKLHQVHLKTPMSEQELSRLSIRWGAYLGEVLKRARPGKWHRDSQKMGKGTMPVVFEPGTEAFPSAWVYKRITDGPEDNVAFKFQVFTNPDLRQQLGK